MRLLEEESSREFAQSDRYEAKSTTSTAENVFSGDSRFSEYRHSRVVEKHTPYHEISALRSSPAVQLLSLVVLLVKVSSCSSAFRDASGDN